MLPWLLRPLQADLQINLFRLITPLGLYFSITDLLVLTVPVPPPVPGGTQEPWGPSRVVRKKAPGLPAPKAPRTGVPGGRAGVLLTRDMGALRALRGREGKGNKSPSTWKDFGGPGSFSFTPSPRCLCIGDLRSSLSIESRAMYRPIYINVSGIHVSFPFHNRP